MTEEAINPTTVENMLHADTYMNYLAILGAKTLPNPGEWDFGISIARDNRFKRFQGFEITISHRTFGTLATTNVIESAEPYAPNVRRKIVKQMKNAGKAARILSR